MTSLRRRLLASLCGAALCLIAVALVEPKVLVPFVTGDQAPPGIVAPSTSAIKSCAANGPFFGRQRRSPNAQGMANPNNVGAPGMPYGNSGYPGLPGGRRYYNGRYFGNYNNRYYGPQYGYF